MSLSLTYEQELARVKIEADGLQTEGAAIYSVQRSVGGGEWIGVRGAVNRVVLSDDPVVFYDYEYEADAENFYRVVGQAGIEFVGVGTADTDSGNGFTLTPPIHSSTQQGDLLVMHLGWSSGIGRHSAEQVSGWTRIINDAAATASGSNRCAVYLRIATGGESDPAVTVGSAIGGATAGIAQIATFRNVGLPASAIETALADQQTASPDEITFPTAAVHANSALIIALGRSQVEWSSVAASSGFTLIDANTLNGGVAGITSNCWQYQVQASAQNVASDVFGITGGTHEPNHKHGHTLVFPYDPIGTMVGDIFTDSVATPLDAVWLKNPLRPARNRVVTIGEFSAINRRGRSGVFDVVGSEFPIEVSEVRSSRQWTQTVIAEDATQVADLNALLDTGETLFLQVPDDCPIPHGYINVGDSTERRGSRRGTRRHFDLPLTEVASPAPTVVPFEEL